MGVKLGFECKMYYCAAGIGGTPVWTEIKGVGNVSVPFSKGEAPVPTRGNGGYMATVGALIEAGVEMDVPYVEGDTDFLALLASFTARSIIGIAVMSGDIATAGSEGLWMDCEVMAMPLDQPIDKNASIKTTLKPTFSANAPQWKTIA